MACNDGGALEGMGFGPLIWPVSRRRSALMARANTMALRSAPTVAELCNDYAKDMQSGKLNGKKDSTIKSDLTRIKTHIQPKFGKLKVNSVTRDQSRRF
jgi:hypothetical protein